MAATRLIALHVNALMKIEGFRSLNSDIETIIAKSEKVKKAKKEGTKDLTPKQKKELSDEELVFLTIHLKRIRMGK